MTYRPAVRQIEAEARQSLVALARAMLHGTISYFEGAPKVLDLKNQINGIGDRDEDFDAFVVIQSETDHLPLQKQRHLWSQEALAKLEPEFVKTEEWARTFAARACKDLIVRFGSS